MHNHINVLNLDDYERGKLHKVWFDIVMDATGHAISIPLLIGRGVEEGPVLGLTAAVHGNELNGIVVIQSLMDHLDSLSIKGTIVGCPVVNVPSYIARQRRYIDGVDLNHIMPGKKSGNLSESYAYKFCSEILPQFNFLIDLHTASFGRVNSYYVRANLDNPISQRLAELQNAQIMVQSPAHDGTLRAAAEELGVEAITLELGNPGVFQKSMIAAATQGLMNAIVDLGMVEGEIRFSESKPVICSHSYWIYTTTGGLLRVLPELSSFVKKGDEIGYQLNMFGDRVATYLAPEDGVVIGKSVNPVNQTGGRILHIGIQR